MIECKIKYHKPCADLERIEKLPQGDWIDLRAAETVSLKAGEYKVISLGISVQLPEGYEAHILPRSSTFKNWGIIQTNGMGIVDNSYCGDNDVWGMPVFAVRDTVIHINDRICQCCVVPVAEKPEFSEVSKLDGGNRGGFGSTGKC